MLGRAAATIVRLYQVTLGRVLPPRCRFHPSCSAYTIQALRTNGLLKGSAQSVWRIVRCGPWSAGGIDHVRVCGPGPIRRALRARLRTRHG